MPGRKKQGHLAVFIEKGLIERNRITANYSSRRKRPLLMVAAIIFLGIAAARPSWNMKSETVEQRGRDVVFLLDVSKSMLAEDLAPNRLERAKLAIRDCIEVLGGGQGGPCGFCRFGCRKMSRLHWTTVFFE